MLYLIKGSRVREYRRQNIDILSAAEHTPFEVSYSHRWVQAGLRPVENDGAVIVFADSPYERFDPVRFAVIEQVDDVDGRLVLRGRLGPFVCAADRSALTTRWSATDEDDPERPGRRRFLVNDDNVGLYTPNSPAAFDDAWRSAVDALSANGFFEDATIARLVRATTADHELESESSVSVGDVVAFEIELRSPHPTEETFAPTLLVEPDGAAELVDDETTNRLPASGTATVRVRMLEPGPVELTVGIAGRALTSTRVHQTLTVRGEPTRPTETSTASAGLVDVTAVARLLSRHATMDHERWLELLDDHLVRARPHDPMLLNLVAEHASKLGRHDRAMRALESIDGRTPSQQVHLLIAAIVTGTNDRIDDLIDNTDLSNGDDFDRFLEAVTAAPEATVNLILRSELRDRHLGDERRADLVTAAWPRLSSIDLMCDAADHVAYVDPEAGAHLLLKQWPQPPQMPDQAMALLLDWKVRKQALGTYVRERLRRSAENDDYATITSTIGHLDCVSRTDQPALLVSAGRVLLAAKDTFTVDKGLELCELGVHQALEHDQLDLAIDAVASLRTATATKDGEVRARVAALGERVDSAIVESDALDRWERMKSATRADTLRPRTAGKRLFALGGKPLDGFDSLADELGLAAHRWIETDKDKGPNHDWADGLRAGDIVIAVLPWIGHSESGVKDKAVRKGASFEIVRHNVMSLLEGIERALDG